MSYQERRALVSLFSTVLSTTVYSVLMLQRYPAADPYSADVFHFWGSFFVIMIPVSIVVNILTHIAFSILHTIATREEEPSITDERDKQIEMRAARTALYVFAFGFVVAMGSLVVRLPPTVMFILLILTGVSSSIVSDIAQFYYYRRGI